MGKCWWLKRENLIILDQIYKKCGYPITENFSDGPILSTHLKLWEDRISQQIKFCEKNLYETKPRQIKFNIVNNKKWVASCWSTPEESEDQYDLILISHGTIATVMDLYQRLLAHPKIMSSLGFGWIEVERPKLRPSHNLFTSSHIPPLPYCMIRQAAALLMCEIAISSIIGHELGHLRHGHYEFFISQKGSLDSITSQALEMDADTHGIWQALSFANMIRKNEQSCTSHYSISAKNMMLNTPLNCQVTTMLCLYALHRINLYIPWHYNLTVSHPSPKTRQAIALLCMVGLTQRDYKNFDLSTNEAIQINVEAFELAESYCDLVLDNEFERTTENHSDFIESLNKYKEHQALLSARWTEIRPELLKYQRGGTLAP